MVLSPRLPALAGLHGTGVQGGREGEVGPASPWESCPGGAVFAFCFCLGCCGPGEWSTPRPASHARPSHPFAWTALLASQALPAHSKDRQANGEVLLGSLLLGHIWVEGAVPYNGGPPGGAGQDFRPGPGQGRDGGIRPLSTCFVRGHCHLPRPGPQGLASGSHPGPALELSTPDPAGYFEMCNLLGPCGGAPSPARVGDARRAGTWGWGAGGPEILEMAARYQGCRGPVKLSLSRGVLVKGQTPMGTRTSRCLGDGGSSEGCQPAQEPCGFSPYKGESPQGHLCRREPALSIP